MEATNPLPISWPTGSSVGLATLVLFGAQVAEPVPGAAAATTIEQQRTMGKFVYVEGDGATQDFDIYVANRAGTDLVDLSNNDRWDTGPDFSTNGRLIAFSSDRDADRAIPIQDRPFDIYVMNADGSDVRRLTDDPGKDANPDWSPNGRRIAWGSCEAGGTCDVHVMNADGSGKTKLTDTDDHNEGVPRWSPNGRRILFASDRDRDPNLPAHQRGRDLYVMNADGSGVRRLTESGYNTFADWSHNGRRIVFMGGDQGNEIFVMNADGTDRTRLRDGTVPLWAPNGRRIAFGWQQEGYLMDPDGGNVRKLQAASGRSLVPKDWVAARGR
ncbi:MAG: TolB family protein [Gemmatimonadota bacterium]